MIKELIKFANHLDQKGLHKEADYVDNLITKFSKNHHGLKSTLQGAVDYANNRVSSDHVESGLKGLLRLVAKKCLNPNEKIDDSSGNLSIDIYKTKWPQYKNMFEENPTKKNNFLNAINQAYISELQIEFDKIPSEPISDDPKGYVGACLDLFKGLHRLIKDGDMESFISTWNETTNIMKSSADQFKPGDNYWSYIEHEKSKRK